MIDLLCIDESMFVSGQLKATYSHGISSLIRLEMSLVYRDESVLGNGTAGCIHH